MDKHNPTRKRKRANKPQKQSAVAEGSSQLLQGYVTESELARQFNRTHRTLIRWRVERTGPPCTYVGRTPMYNLESAMAWLKSRETRLVRPWLKSRKDRPARNPSTISAEAATT
jgi:hypothetical protein